MTQAELLRSLLKEIYELMGTLSIEEIVLNPLLSRQIEVALGSLKEMT